jgi:hypothetical protein
MRVRHNAKLRAFRLCHPNRQVRERPILLLHDVGSFPAIAVLTDDQQLLAMTRVEPVVNRHLRTLCAGSMLLAADASAKAAS